ncbi:GntR family transcriptional regulator [Flavobacterium gilvum]|nr:GntR family transcriptional regulator [Flavobacterium gilvum]
MTKSVTNIIVNIDNDSSVPKYNQIEQCISNDIINGKIKKGQRIPSITELSNSCSISKDTVGKAYKILRQRNLVFPVFGKGYYVSDNIPVF